MAAIGNDTFAPARTSHSQITINNPTVSHLDWKQKYHN